MASFCELHVSTASQRPVFSEPRTRRRASTCSFSFNGLSAAGLLGTPVMVRFSGGTCGFNGLSAAGLLGTINPRIGPNLSEPSCFNGLSAAGLLGTPHTTASALRR